MIWWSSKLDFRNSNLKLVVVCWMNAKLAPTKHRITFTHFSSHLFDNRLSPKRTNNTSGGNNTNLLIVDILFAFIIVCCLSILSSASALVQNDSPNPSTTSALSGLNGNITTATDSATISPTVQNYTLRNLEPYTEYLVTLRVFNPQGDGPTATLAATTDEGGKQIEQWMNRH